MLDISTATNVSVALLVIFIFLAVYWFWSKTSRRSTKYINIPPFPVPPSVMFGHSVKMSGNIRDVIKTWRESTGDVFSLELDGQLNIVVCGYENLKELHLKHSEKITDVPPTFLHRVLKEADKGIITASGDNWREQRSVSLSILRTFGMGKNILAQKIQEEVDFYIQRLAELKGQPTDLKMLTHVSVSNVICSIIVGRRFEHDDPYFVRFMKHLNNIAVNGSRMPSLGFLPFLWFLLRNMHTAKQLFQSVREISEMFVMKHITKTKKCIDKNKKPFNFISAYLQEFKRKTDCGEPTLMDDDNLIAIIGQLLATGTETTATTILWCILYVIHHPEVQERMYKEITAHVGTGSPPNIQDKLKLPYLNAVIQETQRLASLLPVATRRLVSIPFELKGYTFPVKSVIMPSLDSVLHDKAIWGDPDNFRPERFLDEEGNLLHPEEYIPFSIGKRACIGEAVAKMELFLFLSSMFQRFRFVPADPDKLPSLEAIVGVTALPKPFKVKVIERAVLA